MSEIILVADDSLSVREAAQTALRRRGARVELACDGLEARSRLAETTLDLVVADVHMPGLDGYTLCREAKTRRPSTRVLLLVGTFEPFDANAASGARADGVLRKPFVAEELLRRVEELLGSTPAPAPARAAAAEHPQPEAEPASKARPAAASEDASTPAGASAPLELSDADVDRIARRVLELGGEAVLERIAREVLSEVSIERARLAFDDQARSELHDVGGGDDPGGDPERE